MKESPAVVFDLGKVLVDFDYTISAARFARRSRFTPPQVRQLLDHSPLLYRFETGVLSETEFFGEVCAACGFSGSLSEFCEIFADIFSEIKPMTAMQAALRSNKVPTYIFSNTNGIAVRHIRKKFPFFAHFDGYIFSYEVGEMKPDAKIYEALEKLVRRRGADIVYLDDRTENVAGGAARGWQTILHETPEKTRAALENFRL